MADNKLEYQMYVNLGLVSQANNLIDNLDQLLKLHCEGCTAGIEFHQCLTNSSMEEKLLSHKDIIVESSNDVRIEIIIDVALFITRNSQLVSEIEIPSVERDEPISDMSEFYNADFSHPTSPERDSSTDSAWTPSSPHQWTPSSPERKETSFERSVLSSSIQQPSTSIIEDEQPQPSTSGEATFNSKKGKSKNRRQKHHKSVHTVETREKQSLKQLGKNLRKLTKKYLEKSVQIQGNTKAKSAITLLVSRLRQAEDMAAGIEKNLKL